MNKFWTPHLDNLMRRHYPKGDLDELAARIGVTRTAIKSRAKVLGLKRKVNLRRPWTERQLGILRRHYATTLNEELAGCIGISQSTMRHKARELGLEKDAEWLKGVWNERRKVAQAMHKLLGHPGSFKKGQRAYPAGEFKPWHRFTPEQVERRQESIRRWYRLHPAEAKAKAAKAWETRRQKQA